MIAYRQITNADDILSLDDYYVLALEKDPEADPGEGISSFSLMHTVDGEVINEAVIPLDSGSSDEDSPYSEIKVSSGIARLLIGSTVVAEPGDLASLRFFLEHNGYDGEISFVPAARLVGALFPNTAGASIEQISDRLGLKVPSDDEQLQQVRTIDAIFRKCRQELGEHVSEPDSQEDAFPEKRGPRHTHVTRTDTREKPRVSTKTLRRWSEDIWKISPWVLGIAAIAVLILVFTLILPKKESKKIDRNEAPINYLVLSWNDTGKYGTKPKSGSGAADAIQFRIPYGVYNVLNNNSIPVEVQIIKEGTDLSALSDSDIKVETASELSTGNSGEEEEEAGNSSFMKVTIRPNSSRQITIDEEQYLTLSEDATDLVFFYLSEVPEEPESDTTGQISAGSQVIYAYVKGTEVRFRKAPSLEGQIIDALNDGQQVQVLAVTGEWTHVQVGDQKGYIFSQFLTDVDPNATKKPETEETAKPEDTAATASSGTNSSATPTPAATPAGNAAATTTTNTTNTSTASDDKPSNAIEDSPLANSQMLNSKESESTDNVIISETGPTSQGSEVQAQTEVVSTGNSVSDDPNKPKSPAEIAVPESENPTGTAPTAAEGA